MNDVILSKTAAYFTDSILSQFYSVSDGWQAFCSGTQCLWSRGCWETTQSVLEEAAGHEGREDDDSDGGDKAGGMSVIHGKDPIGLPQLANSRSLCFQVRCLNRKQKPKKTNVECVARGATVEKAELVSSNVSTILSAKLRVGSS